LTARRLMKLKKNNLVDNYPDHNFFF